MGILETAKKALKDRELCDHCLGRLFGKLGHGMDNRIRGQAIKFANTNGLSQEPGEEGGAFLNRLVASPEFQELLKQPEAGTEGKCWVCNNLFTELDHFVELAITKLNGYEFATFLIGTKVDVELRESEEQLWSELQLTDMEPLKTELNREIGKRVTARLTKPPNFDNPEIVAIIDTRYDTVDLQIASLYIYGRYRKYIRSIPQTKWPCKVCWGKGCKRCNNTGKMYETSVEEIIVKKILEITCEHAHKFHGMGREDIDARMLGNGRPFVIEIVSPLKRGLDLETLQSKINEYGKGSVEVEGLRFSTRQEVIAIKEACHNKTYKLRVEFQTPVPKQKLKKVVSIFTHKQIVQRTPIRVAHRRADKYRNKEVVNIDIEQLGAEENWAVLNITGENGIYIKELIHGDNNRTQPNLAELLGTPCVVKDLDVIHIHDD
ncbi:MAG: tRNA pseudouridine(54/55) synthase Pus10 [Thermoplasmata archaeon]|nr:tRNA pseudouridine(54/55) synthase Pus10 [Thermoplasmata archaeon]